jgi:hypothetical protein
MIDEQRMYLEQHYMRPNGWIIVDQVDHNIPHRDVVDNELKSAVEHYEWTHFVPVSGFVYVDYPGRRIRTWTGQEIGRIIGYSIEWRSNMGDIRQMIQTRMNNGLLYYGTYYKSAGDYARIHLYKTEADRNDSGRHLPYLSHQDSPSD